MIEPRTLARPYARAAFEFSRNAGTLDAWAEAINVAAAVRSEERWVGEECQYSVYLGGRRITKKKKTILSGKRCKIIRRIKQKYI